MSTAGCESRTDINGSVYKGVLAPTSYGGDSDAEGEIAVDSHVRDICEHL